MAPTSSPTTIAPDRRRLWLAALKPPMYSVAIMPILLGTAVARWQTGQTDVGIFATFLASAVLILVWENLSNDVFDAATGIDRNKHHSLVNLTGRRQLIFAIGNACLVAGLLGVAAIALAQGSWVVPGLILLCCLLGYAYQGPPFRLGYEGLGELLCFPCFGPLGVEAAYYSQTGQFSLPAFWASLGLGITTTLVLFCSHFHQVTDDVAAGKRSPVVRLGTARAAALLPPACAIALAAMVLPILAGQAPTLAAIALLSAPVALDLCRFVGEYHAKPEVVFTSKFRAIRFQFLSGALLSLAYALAPRAGL